MTDGYYKCDRCGTFERGPIKKNGSSLGGTDYSKSDYRKIRYGHLKGDDDSGSISRTVDLCHNCRKELTDWLEGGDD